MVGSLQHVMSSLGKGAVLARQRQLRLLRGHPELASLTADLRHVRARLAKLGLSIGYSEDKQRLGYRIQRLTRYKEDLEAKLARKTAELKQPTQSRAPAVDDLRASLPAKTAPVSFLVSMGFVDPRKGGRCISGRGGGLERHWH
jgi:hypothetical protein